MFFLAANRVFSSSNSLPETRVKGSTAPNHAGTGDSGPVTSTLAWVWAYACAEIVPDSTYGRFLTPDPYRASAAPENPQSWNRYAYVQSDPVNRYDPSGLDWWDPNTNTLYGELGEGLSLLTLPSLLALPVGASPFPVFATDVPEGAPAPASLQLSSDKWDVRKDYGTGAVPCTATATQLMNAIRSNFADFANFTGTFLQGLEWGEVQFHPPSGELRAGMSIGINLAAGMTLPDGLWTPLAKLDTSVTVTTATSFQLSLATVPGHLLYPASISFAAIDAGGGTIRFAINLKGNLPSLVSELQFVFGGGAFEDAQWQGFLGAVKDWCSKKH